MFSTVREQFSVLTGEWWKEKHTHLNMCTYTHTHTENKTLLWSAEELSALILKLLCAAGEVWTLSEDGQRDETCGAVSPLANTYIKVFQLNYSPLSGLGTKASVFSSFLLFFFSFSEVHTEAEDRFFDNETDLLHLVSTNLTFNALILSQDMQTQADSNLHVLPR